MGNKCVLMSNNELVFSVTNFIILNTLKPVAKDFNEVNFDISFCKVANFYFLYIIVKPPGPLI